MRVAPTLEQTARFQHFSCPDCHGSLELLNEPLNLYRCRVGHRYTPIELLLGKELALDRALWSSLTALDEVVTLIRVLVAMRDPATPPGEYEARVHRITRLRTALEGIISDNEPVHLEHDILGGAGIPEGAL